MGREKKRPECTCCLTLAEYADSMGNFWCREHSNRGKLLEYGKMAHFAAFHSSEGDTTYAIGEGYALWYTNAALSSDVCIRVLVAGLETLLREEQTA